MTTLFVSDDILIHRPYSVFGVELILEIGDRKELTDAADYDIGVWLLRIDSVNRKSLAVWAEIIQSNLADLISSELVGHIHHLNAILLELGSNCNKNFFITIIVSNFTWFLGCSQVKCWRGDEYDLRIYYW